jgi:hypothetical protein
MSDSTTNNNENYGPANLRPITSPPIRFSSSEHIPYIPIPPDYDILVARVDSENHAIQTPTI